jgi:hypothetical protein
VGQYVDALKTRIINALAIRGLCGTGCEDDGATVLDNLWLLRAADASSPNLSTCRGKETPEDVPVRVSMLLNNYRRTVVLQYMLVTLKCSQ